MTLLANSLLVAVFVCGVHPQVCAEPGIVYRYKTTPSIEIVGVNAIVGLESPTTESLSGCDQRIADLVVDEVLYHGNSDMVAGFRARKPGAAGNDWYGAFTMNTKELYQKLPNPERLNPQRLVRKGAKLLVIYQICGSGGFTSVRDVFAKSAVNNP